MARTSRRFLALALSLITLLLMAAPVGVFAEETSEATQSPAATVMQTTEPTSEPPSALLSALTVEPTAEPTVEPTAEPTVEPTVEPIVEPTAEPTVEPTAEPTVEPTAEPIAEPTVEPTAEPSPTSAYTFYTFSLDVNEVQLFIGATHALAAMTEPAGAPVTFTWASSDEAVATVDAAGIVTGISAGSAVITATALETGLTAQCAVTVIEPIASLLVEGKARIQVGKSYPFTALDGESPIDEATLNWSSSDEAIATVDAAGIVTGVSVGSAVVTAIAVDGSGLSFDFAVEVLRATTYVHTKSNTQFAVSVGENNEEAQDTISSKSRLARSGDTTFQLMRLVLKTDGTEPDVEDFNPDVIIENKDNRCVIQFTSVEETKAAYEALSKADYVKYVVPDSMDSVTSTYAYNSWGAATIKADEASENLATRTSASLKVAVIDSGVGPNSFFSGKLIYGHDYVDNDEDPSDVFGHGTHVAGTIIDLTQALNVSVVAYRTFDAAGNGYTSTITNAIIAAADAGCKVINLSARGVYSAASYTQYSYAINYAISKGVTFCCAAGNDGASTSAYVPACITIPGCIVVGSVNSSLSHSSYSNTGSSLDVSAPGDAIYSCAIGGGFVNMSGTSMATPHISAACAIIKLAHPDYSPSQVESALKGLCMDLGAAGYDTTYGYGVPNLSSLAVYEPASVTVSASGTSLAVGSNVSLSATILPAKADQTVTWSSSDVSIATVDAGGNLTAVETGNARITAQAVNGVTGWIDITVLSRTGGDILISAIRARMPVGIEFQLSAQYPDEALSEAAVWSSSNQAIMTVDSLGVIMAINPGTARITVTAGAYSGYIDLTVTSVVPASIAITSPGAEVKKGSFTALNATVLPADANQAVIWSTSDSSILSLMSDGTVYASQLGTATLTARAVNDITASIQVTVGPADPESVSVSASKTTMRVGETLTLTATPSPADANPNVTWSSSDANVATVSAGGAVTGAGHGNVRITATTVNGATGYIDMYVGPRMETTSIVIGKRQTQQLTVADYVGAVTWSSADSAIAKVSSTGLVTGVKPGTTYVTASVDGETFRCDVRVSKPILSSTALTLSVSKKSTLSVGYTVKTVKWSSSRSYVASVTSSGKITAKRPGTAVITATVDGYKLKCTVTVKANAHGYKVDMSAQNYDYGASMALKKVYYSGSSIYLDLYLVNNYSKTKIYKIKTLYLYVYDEESGTLLAKKKFSNLYVNLNPGKMKKLTFRFTGSATEKKNYELRLRSQIVYVKGSLILK